MTGIAINGANNYFNLSSTSIKKIEDTGTVVQILVPCSTALYSLWMQDYSGLGYLVGAFSVNQLAIEALKRIVPEKRPNGGRLSFPSGHTMATAFGAISLIKRYGIKNIPAVLVITSSVSIIGVGASRVIAKAHWLHDVVAGLFLVALSGV